MTMTRPLHTAHKIKIEQWLCKSHELFTRTDITYQDAVAITRPYRREAKELGLKIKHYQVGARWIEALLGKANFAVDIRKFALILILMIPSTTLMRWLMLLR